MVEVGPEFGPNVIGVLVLIGAYLFVRMVAAVPLVGRAVRGEVCVYLELVNGSLSVGRVVPDHYQDAFDLVIL